MRKRLTHILFAGILMTMFTMALGIHASAFTYQSVPSNLDLSTFRVTIGGVTLPLEEYPDGGWFDPSKSTMTADEAQKYGISGSVNLRGWECVGFARYVYTALYYQYPADATIDTSLGYDHGSSYAYRNMIYEVLGTEVLDAGYSSATLKTLITSCYPGSLMRVDGHTMVIMAIFNEGFVVYDANFQSSNVVDMRLYTWDSFVQSLGSRNITAVHMPAYYPGYWYSTGASGGGVDEDYDLDTSSSGIYDVVNVNTYLNVRSAPSYTASVVGKVYGGETVVVRGTYGGWAAVEFDSAVCWVHTDYLSYAENQSNYPLNTLDAGPYQVYNCTKLNIRSGPDSSFEKVTTIPAGTVLDIIGTYNGWGAFNYEGQTCWGYLIYLAPSHQDITVTFDANGGTGDVDHAVYKIGTQFSELPSAEKSKRTLVGWFDGKTQYTEKSLVPGSDLTLKAKWIVYSYQDVEEEKWFAPFVEEGYDLGVIVMDTLFNPDRETKRCEFVTVLSRIYTKVTGEDISGYRSSQFVDVNQKQYYAAPIGWAYENGIVYGMSKTEFYPEASITREQMATILYRYACKMGRCQAYQGKSYLGEFKDGANVTSWAREAMNWAADTGIMVGDPNGYLYPQDSTKRSEMVTIAVRFIKYMQEGATTQASVDMPPEEDTTAVAVEPATEPEESGEITDTLPESPPVQVDSEEFTVVEDTPQTEEPFEIPVA